MIKVRLNGTYVPTVTMTQADVLYSRAITAAATYSPTYQISDAQFVLQKVEMPAGYTSKLSQMMKGGGAMNYDFTSATNYKISQLASELDAANTFITEYDLNASSAVRPWNANHNQRTGLVGVTDGLSAYQLFYEGKLNPSRKVECGKISSKLSVDAQPLIELEKALTMGGIKPFSMLKFRENFCIGRALSLQNGVYDARGRDFALQVEYQETQEPVVNKLWNCFCVHLRRIVISGNAIALQV